MEEFPENAGFPNLGVFVLQMHYTNKALEKNITDTSGVTFTYTKHLRDKTYILLAEI